tara:strand:+ start:73 stop:369 length:297 start_codon:yes stop_codon:yes gene_type:complete
MKYDPIPDIEESELNIDNSIITNLELFSKKLKFIELSGVNIESEREKLNAVLDKLIKSLLTGIKDNPSKLWVMKHFQIALVEIEAEDTEAREHFYGNI